MKAENYEIERKYLIEYPDMDMLRRCADISEITQTYLRRDESGRSERVRKRGRDGAYTYTHTVKKRISDIRRTEDEREINRQEYEELLRSADPERNVIHKLRCCLEYMEQMFEIDIFPFWTDRAMMEIELDDEEQKINFPPSIKIIAEITHDRRYTNASLAKQIPYDNMEQVEM